MTIHTGHFSTLPDTIQTVIFLGNRDSDHLRELVRIAEFKGRIAYRIQQASELQPRWFVDVREVGVVVGAAGLDTVLRAVLARLHSFAAAGAQGLLEGAAR